MLRFLMVRSWSQEYKAKVSWKDVCLPKNEGGLGLRPLKEINTVHSLKLIWRLCSESSLWVRWIQCYLIKKNTFWSVMIYHRFYPLLVMVYECFRIYLLFIGVYLKYLQVSGRFGGNWWFWCFFSAELHRRIRCLAVDEDLLTIIFLSYESLSLLINEYWLSIQNK